MRGLVVLECSAHLIIWKEIKNERGQRGCDANKEIRTDEHNVSVAKGREEWDGVQPLEMHKALAVSAFWCCHRFGAEMDAAPLFFSTRL